MENKDLLNKCIKVVRSCKNQVQFKHAVKFCNLAGITKEVQSDSRRLSNFIIPIERAFAIKEYLIRSENNEATLTKQGE